MRWWFGVHVLLAVATVLVAWPWPVAVAVLLALGAHAARGSRDAAPAALTLTAAGECSVPGVTQGFVPLGAGSCLTRSWVRLVNRPRGLEIVVLADQLEPTEWAQLSAQLRRLRLPGQAL